MQRVVAPALQAGKTVVIPTIRDGRQQRNFDRSLYRLRHHIENFFARLKQWRGIATRYDKTARSFLGQSNSSAPSIGSLHSLTHPSAAAEVQQRDAKNAPAWAGLQWLHDARLRSARIATTGCLRHRPRRSAIHVQAVQDLLGVMQVEKQLRSVAARGCHHGAERGQALFAKLDKMPPTEVYRGQAPLLARFVFAVIATEMTRFHETPYGKKLIHSRYAGSARIDRRRRHGSTRNAIKKAENPTHAPGSPLCQFRLRYPKRCGTHAAPLLVLYYSFSCAAIAAILPASAPTALTRRLP